jgi:hypothetical protein
MIIVAGCLYCFKGRQPWVLFPKGAYYTSVEKKSGAVWLGHRVPLWMMHMTHKNRENPWDKDETTTNLYEACRGMPVSFSAKLYWGPRPYFAYFKNTHVRPGAELIFRYDGQQFAKLAVPESAKIAFRPMGATK